MTVAFALWKISINQDRKLINLNFMSIYNVIIIFESFLDDVFIYFSILLNTEEI